jgi:hypothetical protein
MRLKIPLFWRGLESSITTRLWNLLFANFWSRYHRRLSDIESNQTSALFQILIPGLTFVSIVEANCAQVRIWVWNYHATHGRSNHLNTFSLRFQHKLKSRKVKRNFPNFICSSRLFLICASEITALFQKESKSSTCFAEQILITLNHTHKRGGIFLVIVRGVLWTWDIFGGILRPWTYLNKWLINQAG